MAAKGIEKEQLRIIFVEVAASVDDNNHYLGALEPGFNGFIRLSRKYLKKFSITYATIFTGLSLIVNKIPDRTL